MISDKIGGLLVQVAKDILSFLIPFEQTQAIIMRNENKYDRIDIKLKKEADKINLRQIKIEVKQQPGAYGKRKGSITYRSYSLDFKKKLTASIREQLQNTNACLSKIIRSKAKQHGIHPKNITRWYHTKELKKKEGGRKALFPEMEARLAKFIRNNPDMKRKHILKQAKQIMEDLKIPGRQYFNFSKGWYERFRQRLYKNKLRNNVKLEDDIKMEAKHQYEHEVKKEEQSQDEEELYSQEDSYDSEENVKLQANLSEEEQDEEILNIKWRLTNQDSRRMQPSLFFESEDSVIESILEDTTENLIGQQPQKQEKQQPDL